MVLYISKQLSSGKRFPAPGLDNPMRWDGGGPSESLALSSLPERVRWCDGTCHLPPKVYFPFLLIDMNPLFIWAHCHPAGRKQGPTLCQSAHRLPGFCPWDVAQRVGRFSAVSLRKSIPFSSRFLGCRRDSGSSGLILNPMTAFPGSSVPLMATNSQQVLE